MIESQERREEIEKIISRWVKNVKVDQYLRDYDIPHLVSSIIDEFYHITLSCGHQVCGLEQGTHVEWESVDREGELCMMSGTICDDCWPTYSKARKFRKVPLSDGQEHFKKGIE